MNVVSSYVHALEGRLRIKIAEAKGDGRKAREIEQLLQQLTGIDSVSANPTTGNVLILYNPRLIQQEAIIMALQESGYLHQAHSGGRYPNIPSNSHGVVERLTSTVASTIMEVALSHLVSALI